MCINDIGNNPRRSQLDTKIDKSKTQDDGNGPGIFSCRRLSPGKETDGGEDEVGNENWETEFRFVDTAVATGHEAGDGFSDNGGEERCHKGGQIG